jgi:hypothetical protein
MHDLFSLCNIVEMANILNPESYRTGLHTSHRQEIIRGRALSRAIVSWVTISNYEIEHVSTDPGMHYLLCQAIWGFVRSILLHPRTSS